MSLEEVKVVMIGDQPYQSASDVCDIAFGTNNPETPSLLKHIFENMEKTVASFNRPMTNHLDRWLKDGIFLCNFCFTRPTYGSTPPHYHLLWEPFTNNLVQYISNHHSVIFILFGSRAKSLRKSINEIKSVVIEAPHPIYNYKEFKNSNCFRKAREYAGNIGFILNW